MIKKRTLLRWGQAPLIKVYEALGAIADNRVEINGNQALVHSSSGNKSYTVIYDESVSAITSNDNGSFYRGYLGYPSIAVLLRKGVIQFDQETAKALKGFAWKDINTKFKNDFEKTLQHVHDELAKRSVNLDQFKRSILQIDEALRALDIFRLPSANKPPKGY